VLLELGFGLVIHLLDSGGMDPSILEQLLERHAGDLPADAVEPRQDDRSRRVVDDEVDPGEVLERTDVPTLSADDPALHVVRRQLHDRHRGLCGVSGGKPLHADRQDVAHPTLCVAFGLVLDLADPASGVMPRPILDLLEQQLLGPRGR